MNTTVFAHPATRNTLPAFSVVELQKNISVPNHTAPMISREAFLEGFSSVEEGADLTLQASLYSTFHSGEFRAALIVFEEDIWEFGSVGSALSIWNRHCQGDWSFASPADLAALVASSKPCEVAPDHCVGAIQSVAQDKFLVADHRGDSPGAVWFLAAVSSLCGPGRFAPKITNAIAYLIVSPA